MDPAKFDLLILGSGSAAFAAALAAQEIGKTAVMTEERLIGHFGATLVNSNDDISKDEFGIGTARNLGRRVAEVARKLAQTRT